MSKKNPQHKMQESWKELARVWKTYPPPTKPSIAEIYFFEYKIRELVDFYKRQNIKALVLGATPEFRDMLAKYKIQTTILDNNPVMVRAMTSLTTRKNPKETVKIGDWLKMPFKKNGFDLVLSDSAQDNIKFADFPRFFSNVFQILKPQGYWFFGAVQNSKQNSITFQSYIDLYKKDPGYFKDLRNFFFYIFRLSYQKEFYDFEKRIFDFRKIDQKVEKLVGKGELPKSALQDLCLNIEYQQPIISKKEFKELLSKKFLILAEMQDDSHPCMQIKWTAILRPRK